MRRLYTILMVLTALATFASCQVAGDGLESVDIANGTDVSTSLVISPSCVVEPSSVSRAKSAGVAVRSLIDQITTKRMDSNFLRLDEDLDATINTVSNNKVFLFHPFLGDKLKICRYNHASS